MAMLVPVDLTAPSRCAIALASRLQESPAEDALLLHVTTGHSSLGQLARLHALAEPLRERGVPTRLRTLEGRPSTTICDEALARRSRLVVMGTRGEAVLDEDWGAPGSVAREVLNHSSVPVIAVRPGQIAGGCWLEGVAPRPARPRVAPQAHNGARGRIMALAAQIAAGFQGELVATEAEADMVVASWEDGMEAVASLLARFSGPVVLVGTPSQP